jgi:hypothetical protein
MRAVQHTMEIFSRIDVTLGTKWTGERGETSDGMDSRWLEPHDLCTKPVRDRGGVASVQAVAGKRWILPLGGSL